MDIWLYTRSSSGGEEFLCNQDNQNRYHCRSLCHLLPVKYLYWADMDLNVTIPAGAHAISRIEYGPSYHKTVLYRADCLHNAWHGRPFY